MWIPDRGLAQVASWRIAATIPRRHPGIRVRWIEGPMGVEYDVMELTGDGRLGPFHVQLNRTGTILCWLEDGTGGEPELRLGWDEAIGRDPGDDGVDLVATVRRIERAIGLVPEESRVAGAVPFSAGILAAVVAFHVGCGRRVSTFGAWVEIDAGDSGGEGFDTVLRGFPGLVEHVRTTILDRDHLAEQVWVLEVDGDAVLAIDLEHGVAWVRDRRGPVDLAAAAYRFGNDSYDGRGAAAWLVGPLREHDELLVDDGPGSSRFWTDPDAETDPHRGSGSGSGSGPGSASASASADEPDPAPQGELGLGVVESIDEPHERFVIIDGRLGYSDEPDGRRNGPWVTSLSPLDCADRWFHSRRRPIAGPDDPRDGLRFHRGDRAYIFRGFRDDDAAWISRFDVGLTAHDMQELVSLLAGVREDLDGDGPWPELEEARTDAEELVAMVAEGGSVVFALHYLLLDGRTVISPQFREDGEWTDSLPYTTPVWQAEARRVLDAGIAAADPANLMEGEDPANDPFMLMGVAEYLPIHPTMARAFMELFDRGHPVPASIARLAEGAADDLVGPETAGIRLPGPVRRIALMRALYDGAVGSIEERR